VLSLAISDNGVGIERRMFEYWKDRYPVFNRAYYFKSLSTKMAKSLIGHFGDGVVYFLWPSEDYDFCHSHGCFLADGAFSFHHEIEFRSRKKGCPGYSLLVPNPVNGVREEFVLTEPAEDIPLGTTVSLNIRLQTKDDIAKLRKVFYDGDRLDVEKVFLQLDMVRNNSDSISRSL